MNTQFIRENKPINVSSSSQAWFTDKLNQALDEYDALLASHTQLKEAFGIYGGHLEDCNLNSLIPKVKTLSDPPQCDCGYDEALSEAEKL